MSDETLEKKDKLKLFISKIKENSKLLASAFLIILIVFIVLAFLENRKTKEDIFTSKEFNNAKILIKNKKKQESFIILERIIDKKHKFYSPLSLYLILDLELEKDQESILKLFDKVISIKKLDKESINLIKIKKALFLSNHYGEQEILKELNPIINSNSVWRSNAINILIDYFSSKGSFSKADQYKKLINNKDSK
jgi:hypothetical protein|tara:strand:+ start:1175 stop:1759 length:585 start_codon:yes stop_codon:yes gene_type:complete